MNTFKVHLGKRSYPIYINEGLLENSQILKKHVHGDSVFIISNQKVAPLYLDKVSASCTDYKTTTFIIPDGEKYKNLGTIDTIYSSLLENKIDRNTTLIALGGGVVGDIAGFAAATYQRGVNFIQMPTTLLAQVDSSVGGKTGVNHALGKNMIGAFYQPQCVIADLKTLETLNKRELSAGIAEIIKYGLISDANFFTWLENNINQLLERDSNSLAYAVHHSCKNKAQIVAEDEFEVSGKRALLNYGHTFGHAIETGVGYGNWLHGEAVACGMVMAANLSLKIGWLSEKDFLRIVNIVTNARLPTKPPKEVSSNELLKLMAVDKKSRAGKLQLVLLNNLGSAILTQDFSKELLDEVLSESCSA